MYLILTIKIHDHSAPRQYAQALKTINTLLRYTAKQNTEVLQMGVDDIISAVKKCFYFSPDFQKLLGAAFSDSQCYFGVEKVLY